MISDRVAQSLSKLDSTLSVYTQPELWLKENSDQLKAAFGDIAGLRITGLLYPRTTTYIHILSGGSANISTTSPVIEYPGTSFKQISQIWRYQIVKNSISDCLRSHDYHSYTIGENWEMIQRLDNLSILARVIIILRDHQTVREFIQEKGPGVDPFLDLLQELLDADYVGNARPLILRSLLHLSKQYGVYPKSLILQGIAGRGSTPTDAGSFGMIYQGTYHSNTVAIKSMRQISAKDPEKLEKAFIREAVLWRQFSHPNVLPFYGIYHWPTGDEFRICLVSPWMKHKNMVEYLDSNPNADRPSLMLDVARGLQYLHEFQDPAVIHGDLKGNNILITNERRACLTDFGLCKLKEDPLHFVPTSSTSATGAWKYLAPELLRPEADSNSNQARNIGRSTASDIYAFGCVCYQIITGRPRFSDLPPFPTIMAALENRETAKPELCTDELWALIKSCWEVTPSSRPHIAHLVKNLGLYHSKSDSLWTKTPIILPGDQTKDLKIDDVIIALLGLAGTGKSSFINTLMCKEIAQVGDDLESCTQSVSAFGCLHPDGSGRRVIVVDTPGFDDTHRFDSDILKEVAQWLEITYRRKITLSGIFHFHSIAESRMRGTPLRNLGMFQALCGENALGNVVLVTTNWDNVPLATGSRREAELKTKFWSPLLEHGSRVARFQTRTYEEAWDLIGLFNTPSTTNPIPLSRPALQVQIEQVIEGKQLHQTAAYQFLLGWWSQLIEKLKRKSDKFNLAKKQKKKLESRISPSSPLSRLGQRK